MKPQLELPPHPSISYEPTLLLDSEPYIPRTPAPCPYFDEITARYTLMGLKMHKDARAIAADIRRANEPPERLRSFLLEQRKLPALRYLLEAFAVWCSNNPVSVEVDYHEYLQSEQWKERRQKHIRLAEERCQLCNAAGELHVHHRTYARLGCERFTDLIALCPPCHAKHHDKLPTNSVPELDQAFERAIAKGEL